MKYQKLRVIDLMSGLGGRSIAFKDVGFDLVCAIDNDKEVAEYYCKTFGTDSFINSNIDVISPNSLPDADVILANFKYSTFSIPGNKRREEEVNKAVYHVIEYHKPKYFVIEAPVSMLSNANNYNAEKFLNQYTRIGYKVFYNVFQERDYSGFPVIGRQLFFVGIDKDIVNEDFIFPESKYLEFNRSVVDYKDSVKIDDWYRKLKISISEVKFGEYYLNDKGNIKKTELINPWYNIRETYVVDSLGLRRFTHNELAKLKGLPIINYNDCSNKRRIYNKIAASTNAYVAREIANNILVHAKNSFLALENELNDNGNKIKSIANSKKTINEKIVYPKQRITKINIEHLKGLNNLEIDIEKDLIAIMGVNGVGKSTILHALACTCRPYSNGKNYKFSFFFTPNPNATWKNSRFSITCFDENRKENIRREYKKNSDRWYPAYNKRPIRDVYFVGIETCIPEIEIEKQTSYIHYSTNDSENKNADKIIKDAAAILNKDYKKLKLHKTKKKQLIGVQTNSVNYSSLSMGAGEQRVLKILELVYTASNYALILIDEIDLLLHITAFNRLIIKLASIAKKRNLQIIFTTHSLEVSKLTEYVDIRYIENYNEKTMVFNKINADMIYDLSECVKKEITIYVEDVLAEVIVQKIAEDLGMLSLLKTVKYGAAENAFIVAASFVLKEETNDNVLVVLDGDVHRVKQEKMAQIKNVLSGTESDHDEKVQRVLPYIREFTLPEVISPEKHIYNMLIEMNDTEEIVNYALRLKAVSNNHEWLDKIVERMGQNESIILHKIIELVSENVHWNEYILEIREWLLEKRNKLK